MSSEERSNEFLGIRTSKGLTLVIKYKLGNLLMVKISPLSTCFDTKLRLSSNVTTQFLYKLNFALIIILFYSSGSCNLDNEVLPTVTLKDYASTIAMIKYFLLSIVF